MMPIYSYLTVQNAEATYQWKLVEAGSFLGPRKEPASTDMWLL